MWLHVVGPTHALRAGPGGESGCGIWRLKPFTCLWPSDAWRWSRCAVREGATFETAGLRRSAVLACYAGTVTYVTGHITDGLSAPVETRVDFARRSGAVSLSVQWLPLRPRPDLFWGRNMADVAEPLAAAGQRRSPKAP